MNIRFLGDAFDPWKGSLLSNLRDTGLLVDLGVEPMLTDATVWTTKDIDAYRKLLKLRNDQLIHHVDRVFRRPAGDYFDQIPENGGLFLDPDTGIARRQAKEEHISIDELSGLCRRADGEKRVLAVYQHKWQGRTMRSTIDSVVPDDLLQRHSSTFVYMSAGLLRCCSCPTLRKDQELFSSISENRSDLMQHNALEWFRRMVDQMERIAQTTGGDPVGAFTS